LHTVTEICIVDILVFSILFDQQDMQTATIFTPCRVWPYWIS